MYHWNWEVIFRLGKSILLLVSLSTASEFLNKLSKTQEKVAHATDLKASKNCTNAFKLAPILLLDLIHGL